MKRCKDCVNIKLLNTGHYRLDKIDWVSPCKDCLETFDDDYNSYPKDHVNYRRKWWKIWRPK
jgi:hypothetical protein